MCIPQSSKKEGELDTMKAAGKAGLHTQAVSCKGQVEPRHPGRNCSTRAEGRVLR